MTIRTLTIKITRTEKGCLDKVITNEISFNPYRNNYLLNKKAIKKILDYAGEKAKINAQLKKPDQAIERIFLFVR